MMMKGDQSGTKGAEGGQRKVSALMQILTVDLMGEFPRSTTGFQNVIVTACLFSKYVWIRPLRNSSADSIANHLKNDVFLKVVLSDNGAQFHSRKFIDLCEEY